MTPATTLDLLASFQHTVIDELLKRVLRAAGEMDARSVLVSGGVACNSGLRRAAVHLGAGVPVRFPSAALSTDNAVMIAAAAFPKFRRGEFLQLSAQAHANLPLA